MNLSKVLEYFDASKVCKGAVNIIGCGAIGSHVVEQLVRMGVENIHLWDFDTVSAHNIANQMFVNEDIGMAKVAAVARYAKAINPQVKLTLHPKGLQKPYVVNGYVFLCVDSIELRKEIVKANRLNPNCIAFFDFRMRLTDAQAYFAERKNVKEVDRLYATMDFTSEEAKESTPVSACGVTLSVVYTVKAITACGVANFARFCLGQPTKNTILVDMNFMCIDAFPME